MFCPKLQSHYKCAAQLSWCPISGNTNSPKNLSYPKAIMTCLEPNNDKVSIIIPF